MALDFYELGKEVCQKIRMYADTRQEKILNEIFHMLIEISTKILFKDYRSVPEHQLDEAANLIAEDALLSISKYPERFIDGDNVSFYPYYKYTLRKKMGKVFADYYAYHRASTSLDVIDGRDFEYRFISVMPFDILARRDRYKLFIKRVSRMIDACPRYIGKSKYLTFPLVMALLLEGHSIFDNLDFRDRVGLRVILTLVHKKKSMLHEFYNE